MWLATVVAGFLGGPVLAAEPECPAALDFRVRPLTGDSPVHLCEAFRGKVVLVVNTASKCAFTPQYEGLENLYSRYRQRGLVVAGFPSNDFGNRSRAAKSRCVTFAV
jgi:glutathione peroxidase